MENVNRILKEKGLTKQQLAANMGISRENLYRILNGNPTLENIKKLAAALDVNITQLFSGSGKSLNGFVEYEGQVYRITHKADLEKVLKLLE